MRRNPAPLDTRESSAAVKQRQIACGHEAQVLFALGVLHVAQQYLETPLRILPAEARRQLPLAWFRIGSVNKVEVPELRSHELGRVVISADHASATGAQLIHGAIEALQRLAQLAGIVQAGAYQVVAHVEDVQHSAEP